MPVTPAAAPRPGQHDTRAVTGCDVLVVGGGIAGASVAAELSSGCDVVLAEREEQLAHHTTGRSAAMFLESYGSAEIRLLTRASRAHMDRLAEVEGTAVLTPRALLWIAGTRGVAELGTAMAELTALRSVDAAHALEMCPALDPEWLVAAALEESACDIDVAVLLGSFVHTARSHGARIVTGAGVVGADHRGGRWRVTTTTGTFHAAAVVVAAGAWADPVAAIFGAQPVGLRPMRRTIAVARPAAVPFDPAWPMVVGIDESFYFRPEGPNLLLSPADETPSPPCDARPRETDVALALERVNAVTRLGLRSVLTAWAGLRTFGPDRNPVVGPDPDVDGLYWLAGQGGYGIQTAPAMARLAAAEVTGRAPPQDIVASGLDLTRLRPERARAADREAAS